MESALAMQPVGLNLNLTPQAAKRMLTYAMYGEAGLSCPQAHEDAWQSFMDDVARRLRDLKAVVVNVTNAVAKAMADAFTTALDAGTAGIITIYTGTIPTDADTAIGAQTLLATLTFSATSFGAATDANPGGLITANAITSDTSADATGTAAWARILTQGGGTTICDVSVGTATSTIIFNTVAFTSGSTIAITSFTFTHPES